MCVRVRKEFKGKEMPVLKEETFIARFFKKGAMLQAPAKRSPLPALSNALPYPRRAHFIFFAFSCCAL